MQGRSWMAALTIAATLVPVPTFADETPAPKPPPAARGKSEPNPPVTLKLSIAGLGSQGCDVEIKPGHPGCDFATVTDHVDFNGKLRIDINDVKIKNADRDCTFAITIREPGQAVRTMRRGLRLSKSADNDKATVLDCYLSSPSRIANSDAKDGDSKTSKR